jgi:hypothetical protein
LTIILAGQQVLNFRVKPKILNFREITPGSTCLKNLRLYLPAFLTFPLASHARDIHMDLVPSKATEYKVGLEKIPWVFSSIKSAFIENNVWQ